MKLFFLRHLVILALFTATTMTAMMTALQTPTATLLVTIDGPDWRIEQLTEGARGYFRILRNGVAFLEKDVPGRPTGYRSIRLDLPAGDFELVSYVRGPLLTPTGPPLDECRSSFSIKDGEMLYVSRKQSPQGMCGLLFSTTKPVIPENRR